MINHSLAHYLDRLWRTDLRELPLIQAWLYRILRVVHSVYADLLDGQLSLRATSLVYTTVIALVPLLALSFSVLKGLGVHNQLEPALLGLLEPLGEQRFEIIEKLIGFVDNIKVGVLGGVGFAFLVYSVVAMLQKIERAFNLTWRINRNRGFMQRVANYLGATFVGPLLIFLSVALSASVRSSEAVEYFATLPGAGILLEWLGAALPYLIMGLGFSAIYMLVPNTRVSPASALLGGLVTAVIWKVMGLIFANFIATSDNNTLIYSAFASVIVFMLWLYLGWFVLLIGASVAYHHQHPHPPGRSSDWDALNITDRERVGLALLYVIAEQFERGRTPLNQRNMADQLRIPESLADEVLQQLCQGGVLLETRDEPPRYVPSQGLNTLDMHQLLCLIRGEIDVSDKLANQVPGLAARLQEHQQLMDKQYASGCWQNWVSNHRCDQSQGKGG